MKRKNKTSLFHALRLLSPYLSHRWAYLLFILILSFFTVALTLAVPCLIGLGVDEIVGEGNVDLKALGKYLFWVLICVSITALLQWLVALLNQKLAYEVVQDLRSATFAKLQKLPLSYLDGHPTGDILSRMTQDADAVADGLLIGFTQLFTGVLTVLGTLGFLIWLNLWVALCVAILTPLSLFASSFIAKRSHQMFRLQSESRGAQTAYLEEMVAGQREVRAFGREEATAKELEELNETLRRHSLRATFFSSLVNPTTRVVNNLVYAAVALLGGALILFPQGWWAFGSALTVGGLFSCLAYANQYTKPFNEISAVLTEVQNASACATRIHDLLDEVEVTEREGARELTSPRGEIQLRDVEFSYVPENPLIRDITLTCQRGMRVAIVGPTGCGKTTLINLLMRFYDVQGGEIRVDGYDIRDLTRASLRKNIGMVLQDTWIRQGTVLENIALGRPDATREEVEAAARASHAHSFIRRLPKGYDTLLQGDNSLSGGQKQLLSIARVMLTHPAMLILDEATSSLDSRTESKVQDAFSRLMEGRTTFIVAHRLSTIREADLILVMDGGKVVEQGKHDQLLAQGGFYANLYHSQFEA